MMRGKKGVEKADCWSSFCTSLCSESILSPWPALGQDVLSTFELLLSASPLKSWLVSAALSDGFCTLQAQPGSLPSVWWQGSLGVPWAAEGSPTPASGGSRGSAFTSLGQVLVESKSFLSWTSAVVPTDREILQGLCSFVVLFPDP